MAEVAVGFALERLTTLGEKLREVIGVQAELENIKEELERMKAFLRDADAKEGWGDRSQTWVNQVRDIAYDTEDVLDKFALGLTRIRQQQDNTSIGIVFKCLIGRIRKFRLKVDIFSQITSIKYRLSSTADGNQRYQSNLTIPEEASNSNDGSGRTDLTDDTRGDAFFAEDAQLVGMESLENELIGKLMDDDRRLIAISVTGMAGSGKTSLVSKVYKDGKVKKHFQSRVWKTVSQPFNLEELLKDTIRQLYDGTKQELPQGMDSLNSNQQKELIKQFLQDKRYVIVFDDLWNTQEWEAIRRALPNNSCGSRVIVTTRQSNVARDCQIGSDGTIGNVYTLEPLNPEHSWMLFCKKAFPASSCPPPHLTEISHKILDSCGGLPLVICAVGGFLATKRSYEEWVTFDQSLGQGLECNDVLASLRRILSLSFNYLPYYLKPCLLYIAIYPEACLINSNNLIQMWIVEGLVKTKGGTTPKQIAQGYLKELANRNLIQVVSNSDHESIKSFRMHKSLREILVLKSRKQSFLMIVKEPAYDDEGIEKARRLSIHGPGANFDSQRCGTKLRSLFAFGVTDLKSIFELVNRCRILKVLNLSGFPVESFPEVITKLLLLRYLSLRDTKIKSLPRSIKKLQMLEILVLKNTFVMEVPVEILKLKNLRHLVVYCRCKNDSKVLPFNALLGFKPPGGMGALTSLEVLYFVEATTPGVLTELPKMKALRKLGISKLKREDGMDLCSSIEKLPNLQALHISSTAENEILDLDHMSSPPAILEELYLTGRLEKVPCWIKSLNRLVSVNFRWSQLRDDPLEYLQDLPNLVHLDLLKGYVGEELGFRACKFQRLNKLNLDSLAHLKRVIFEEGAVPNLEKILIQRCPCLETVPSGIERLTPITLVEFFDMPQEFIMKLNPDMDGGDYWKVAHIPEIYYTYQRNGAWETRPLETGNEMGISSRSASSMKFHHQHNLI